MNPINVQILRIWWRANIPTKTDLITPGRTVTGQQRTPAKACALRNAETEVTEPEKGLWSRIYYIS